MLSSLTTRISYAACAHYNSVVLPDKVRIGRRAERLERLIQRQKWEF